MSRHTPLKVLLMLCAAILLLIVAAHPIGAIAMQNTTAVLNSTNIPAAQLDQTANSTMTTSATSETIATITWVAFSSPATYEGNLAMHRLRGGSNVASKIKAVSSEYYIQQVTPA